MKNKLVVAGMLMFLSIAGLAVAEEMSKSSKDEGSMMMDKGSMMDKGAMMDKDSMMDENSTMDEGAMMDDGSMMDDGAMMDDGSMMKKDMGTEETKPMEVGNKMCPIDGKKIGEMGEPVKYEYKGMTYNLCCKMCIPEFEKNPEKFIKMMMDETK